MKIKLFFLFALLAGQLFASKSFAALEISCWDGDCFKNGWTQEDTLSHNFTEFKCTREDCSQNGWVAGGNQGISYYTECKNGGCFVEGWYELDRANHQMFSQVRCLDHDCWKNGFEVFVANGQYARLTCNQGDCTTKGWKMLLPGYQQVTASCKAGGCFKEGWFLFQ